MHVLRLIPLPAAVLLVVLAAPPTLGASLTVDIPGCTHMVLSGTAPNYTLTCTQSHGGQAPGPSNAPTGCSVTRTPSSGSLGVSGGSISMGATCSGGAVVTSWTWRKNTQTGWSSAQSVNDALPANTASAPVTYTYGFTACAGSDCAPEVQTTFTVAGNQSEPASACSQFSDVVIVDLPWGGNIDTQSYGSIRPGTVLVGRLVVPANAVTASIRAGRFSWVEFGDAPYARVVSLSSQPCDFRAMATFATDRTSVSAPLAWGGGQTSDIYFGVQGGRGTPVLVPGETYYFNMQGIDHARGFSPSCSVGSCNMRLTISTFQ